MWEDSYHSHVLKKYYQQTPTLRTQISLKAHCHCQEKTARVLTLERNEETSFA